MPVLAIDGPAGAGKGTVAAALAERWGWHVLDSGALYRAVGLLALRHSVALADEAALAEVAQGAAVRFRGGRIEIDGVDATAAISEPAVAAAASEVAAKPGVRAALLAAQRGFRRAPGLVADGRDMGTVVFPDAALKVFLTADVAERARRRYLQLTQQSEGQSEKRLKPNQPSVRLRDLFKDIEARDRRDRGRAISPLVAAPDAVTIDATKLSVAEVVAAIAAQARGRY